MSGVSTDEIVIVGTTTEGRVFRPSDWADRLCGCMSLFGADQRISYSPYLKPIVSAGVTCVVVDRRLQQLNPDAYAFLMTFATDNALQMREGRLTARPEPQPT